MQLVWQLELHIKVSYVFSYDINGIQSQHIKLEFCLFKNLVDSSVNCQMIRMAWDSKFVKGYYILNFTFSLLASQIIWDNMMDFLCLPVSLHAVLELWVI